MPNYLAAYQATIPPISLIPHRSVKNIYFIFISSLEPHPLYIHSLDVVGDTEEHKEFFGEEDSNSTETPHLSHMLQQDHEKGPEQISWWRYMRLLLDFADIIGSVNYPTQCSIEEGNDSCSTTNDWVPGEQVQRDVIEEVALSSP